MTVPDPILAVRAWPTNAHLLADCARLGYLDGRVLDATYGLGRWWTVWCPLEFVTNDIKPGERVDHTYDFRHFPDEWEAAFDAVTFDPPYKLNGTPTTAVDAPYGVDVVATRDERHELIREGITECARVLAPEGYLLVKCQDQVNGGKVRWQTHEFTAHAVELGLTLVDALMILAHRPQPEGRRQVHARRNYSTLLVFKKAKHHRATVLDASAVCGEATVSDQE